MMVVVVVVVGFTAFSWRTGRRRGGSRRTIDEETKGRQVSSFEGDFYGEKVPCGWIGAGSEEEGNQACVGSEDGASEGVAAVRVGAGCVGCQEMGEERESRGGGRAEDAFGKGWTEELAVRCGDPERGRRCVRRGAFVAKDPFDDEQGLEGTYSALQRSGEKPGVAVDRVVFRDEPAGGADGCREVEDVVEVTRGEGEVG